MPTHIPIAQTFKIAAGLAQVGLALWIVARRPRNLANTAFAIAFGANGVAYAIFNLALPGQRPAGSLAVEGWGVFNWIAVVAMILFVVFFLQTFRGRTSTWLIALVTIALPMLAAHLVVARAHGVGLLAFGGIAIYPATGFALALFALVFARTPVPDVRMRCALLGGPLAINSVDHLGAGAIQPSSLSPNYVVQVGAMSIILAIWLLNARGWTSQDSRLALAVAVCIIAPFVAGILVRVAVGSYRGVQESGFIGAGRFATTGLLLYGMLARGLFSSPVERTAVATSSKDKLSD